MSNCDRCNKKVHWWQHHFLYTDIYRVIEDDDSYTIYRRKHSVHKKCLSSLEQKILEYKLRNQKKDDNEEDNLISS